MTAMCISPPHWHAGLSVHPGSNNRSNMVHPSLSFRIAQVAGGEIVPGQNGQ
jgi:hypothetical protein